MPESTPPTARMPAALDVVREFRVTLAQREATDIRQVAGGVAVSHRDLPASHWHNVYWLHAPVPVPPLEPPYHLAEYYVDPPPAGTAPVSEEVVMHFDGRPVPPSGALVLPPGGIRQALVDGWHADLPDAGEDVLAQLADRQLVVAAACALTNHVALEDGVPVAWCELRRLQVGGRRVAQIENVVTRAVYRGRGHATAVVRSALATAAGDDVVFLVSEADDWPREWYARLGFADIGRSWTVSRAG